MNKIPVRLGFYNRGFKKVFPKTFFKNMPYILNSFNFLSGDPRYIISYTGLPKTNKVRIFYTYDNIRPDLQKSDWSFGFDYEDHINNSRYMRFPNYVKLGAGNNLIKDNINVDNILSKKKKFCAFLYCNNISIRIKFFNMLSKYKKIDAPGNSCQNMEAIGGYKNGWHSRKSPNLYKEKLHFLKDYKFVISFENSSFPGYTTEKIYHPMLVNCIPIYWGNPLINRDFNTKSFIHPYDLKTKSTEKMLKYLVDQVVELDNNDKLYKKYLLEPWLPNNKLTVYMKPKRLLNRFKTIFRS